MNRIQLALNVDDLEASIAFYSALFGTEPAKRRDGYANFAVAEPPLKLVLLENPGQGGTLNHLGVEVADTDAVDATQQRLAAAGLGSADERDVTCCYARQDKFWVDGSPDGERWEVYTVLEGTMTAEHFYKEGHRKVWRAIERLFRRSEPMDLVTLTEELRQTWSLDRRFEPQADRADADAAHRRWRDAVERCKGWA